MIIRLHLHLRGGTSGDLFRLLGTTVIMLVHRLLCVVTTKITECGDLHLRHLHLGPMIGLPTTHWMMVLRVILLVAMALHLLVIYMIVMIDVPRLQVTGMRLTHQVHRQRRRQFNLFHGRKLGPHHVQPAIGTCSHQGGQLILRKIYAGLSESDTGARG